MANHTHPSTNRGWPLPDIGIRPWGAEREACDEAIDADVQDIYDQHDAHVAAIDNPHSVTKTQVGLGDVENVDTTDASNITTGTLDAARLPASGVSPGAYERASVTVDAAGRVTAIAGNSAMTRELDAWCNCEAVASDMYLARGSIDAKAQGFRPTTHPTDTIRDKDIIPYRIGAQTLRVYDVSVYLAAGAVSTATKATEVSAQVDIYTMTGAGRVLISSVPVPLNAAAVGVSDDLTGTTDLVGNVSVGIDVGPYANLGWELKSVNATDKLGSFLCAGVTLAFEVY